MPRWTQFIIGQIRSHTRKRTGRGQKFILFILFFLGGLASSAKSEAVLPAYLVGLVVAGVFLRDKTLVHRMRSIAFAVFTPFYFIKAGLYVSLPALWTGLFVISAFLLLKMVTKIAGVFPLARLHYLKPKEASLHDALNGNWSDIWNHFFFVRVAESHHQSGTIHDSGERRDHECVRTNVNRSKIFPANNRNDARLGSPLPAAIGNALG